MQPVPYKSWYDGKFYAWAIDSNHTDFRLKVEPLIEPDKAVLDIGCGTGGLSLRLARKSKQVVGVF